MAQVYVAYAHPIGEDAGTFWTAVGTTRERAMERLREKIVESLYSAENYLGEEEDPEEMEAMEADREALDLDDTSEWVVVVDEDTLD